MLTIAAGGIMSAADVPRLADEGYDAVVIGRSLALSESPGAMIKTIRDRVGLQRMLLGTGLNAEVANEFA
jgi:phosphoribosylformimino-5-aminoimidazole carboxamide ribonucleotide (ProFAR) isomerase